MALAVGQSEIIDLGNLSLSGCPFTLTGWFRVPNVAQFLTLMQIRNSTTGSYHSLTYRGHASKEAAAISNVGAVASAKSTLAMVPNQWHQVTGVFEADNLRRIYLDGGGMGTSTIIRVFDGADTFELGNVTTAHQVEIACAGIFATALDEEEIGMLAHGCSLLALPSAEKILAYQDCIRTLNRPGIGPLATSGGTPTVAEHPRMLATNGGRSRVQPYRIRGPLQFDGRALRTSFSEQAQQCVAGADEGQLSVAGIASNNQVLRGEVTN